MREVLVKLYEFDELSDEVKAKVIDSHRDSNTDYMWWLDILDEFITDAEKLGVDIGIKDVIFELQGPGAVFGVSSTKISFDDRRIWKSAIKNIPKYEFWLAHNIGRQAPVLSNVDLYDYFDITIEINVATVGYSYVSSFNGEGFRRTDSYDDVLEVGVDPVDDGYSEEDIKTIEKAVKDASLAVLIAFCDLCERYYNILNKHLEYLQSDEAIIESFKCNEVEFMADGTSAYLIAVEETVAS